MLRNFFSSSIFLYTCFWRQVTFWYCSRFFLRILLDWKALVESNIPYIQKLRRYSFSSLDFFLSKFFEFLKKSNFFKFLVILGLFKIKKNLAIWGFSCVIFFLTLLIFRFFLFFLDISGFVLDLFRILFKAT